MADRVKEIRRSCTAGSTGGGFGKDDAVALARAGVALAYVVGELDDGVALIDRALVLESKSGSCMDVRRLVSSNPR